MRVAVQSVDEVHSRAAASLVSSPLVTEVGLIGKEPPRSWGSRATEVVDGAGFDVVVGRSDGATVSADESGRVSYAGLTGLARSLAARLPGRVATMDRTITSAAAGDGAYAVFPLPVGAVRRLTAVAGVMLCPVQGSMAAVAVSDGGTTIAMVDDVLFASGVCLAAGALLVGHEGPVWAAAETYLRLTESLGLVFAEAITEGS